MADVQVNDDQAPFGGSIQLFNAHNNPVEPDDVPVWSSSDETVATVAAGADGKTGEVTVTGKLGASLITVTSVEAETEETITLASTVKVIPSGVAVRGDIAFDVE